MKRCTLVQVIAITGLTALIRLVPSFQFQDCQRPRNFAPE